MAMSLLHLLTDFAFGIQRGKVPNIPVCCVYIYIQIFIFHSGYIYRCSY